MKKLIETFTAAGHLVRGFVVSVLASKKMPGAKKNSVTVSDVDEAMRVVPMFDLFTTLLVCIWMVGALFSNHDSIIFGMLIGRLLVWPVIVLLTARSDQKSQIEREVRQAAHDERMKQMAADHDKAMAEIRDPGGLMSAAKAARELKEKEDEAKDAAYLAIGAKFSASPHYEEAKNIALAVVNEGSALVMKMCKSLESIELAQEIIRAYSTESDRDPRINSHDVTSIPWMSFIVIARKIMSCEKRLDDSDLYNRFALKILANHRDTLTPHIAALRIRRTMADVIETAISEIEIKESAVTAPRRRNLGV